MNYLHFKVHVYKKLLLPVILFLHDSAEFDRYRCESHTNKNILF